MFKSKLSSRYGKWNAMYFNQKFIFTVEMENACNCEWPWIGKYAV